MALTSSGFEGYINLVDTEGSRSTLRYDLQAADFTTAASNMASEVALLNAITDAVVAGYGVGEKFSEDALTLPAAAEIEKRAVISAKIADSVPTKYVNIIVPAPSQGIFVSATGPNAKVVDPNDADVIAYLASFEDGGFAFVSDGENIADSATSGNWYGKKTHRGSRNG